MERALFYGTGCVRFVVKALGEFGMTDVTEADAGFPGRISVDRPFHVYPDELIVQTTRFAGCTGDTFPKCHHH